MEIEIIESEIDSIKSEYMKRIAQSQTSVSKCFVARFGDQELGIIKIFQYKPPLPLFIYFIYVEHKYRKKGVGTKLLEFAEQMAISRGNPSVLLQPDEVESDIPFQELIQWYIRKGYSWKEDDPKRMEKLI
jgi:GNAT superfamily N-acetyltransferase